MATRQGSLALLQDPVALALLTAPLPARLAYTWTDGTPRIVPIAFYWNGTEVVLGTPPDAPKLKALTEGSRVALSIDTNEMPCKVLQIRGSVHLDTVDGLAPEYVAAVRRMMGDEQGQVFLAQARAVLPRMTRIFIRPEWVAVMDFEARFPNALERSIERHMAAAH